MLSQGPQGPYSLRYEISGYVYASHNFDKRCLFKESVVCHP